LIEEVFMNIKKILIALSLIALPACAPQQSAIVLGGTNDGFSYTPSPTPGVAPDPALLEKVDIDGFIENASDYGLTGTTGATSVSFDKEKLELVLYLPMPGNIFFSIPQIGIPNHPDIIVGTEFDAVGTLRLKIRIPVKYVLKGINLKDGARLPSGEALPPTPAGSGELPGLAIEFPSQKLFLYIGVNSLGAYITLPDNVAHPLIPNITAKIKNKQKDIVGYLTYVSPKNGFQPGLFLGTRVPPKFAKFLEDYLGL
jgi:hypothetical protein